MDTCAPPKRCCGVSPQNVGMRMLGFLSSDGQQDQREDLAAEFD